ncbi:MAG: 47 kDa outer membrane protein [bacterium]|nr:47 kDa outer membrane protein [bacterium]
MRKWLLILLLPLLAASSLLASGFGIYEFGGRGSGMAGALVARSWDGSTIFYNPAGLAFLKGTQFYGGTTLIFPNSRFVGAFPIFTNEAHKTRYSFFTPIGIYFSHKFSEKLGAGIGVTNPFGLGVEWHDSFSGRGISKNAQLQSFYFSPVLAYQITPNLSIGGGPDVVIAKVKLERNVFLFSSAGSPGYEVGEVDLTGTSKLAVGFTASAMFRTEKVGIGLHYRHSIRNEFNDGEAKFTIFDNLTVSNAATVAKGILTDQKVKTAINFPNYLATGLYYKFTKRWGVEADYLWFNWSVFDKMDLDFTDDRLDQAIPEEYQDSWQIRLGTHYELTEALSLRAGYIRDNSPQPIQAVSPLLPDDTRDNFSLGAGYNFGKFQIDAGYMLVYLGKRSTIENGTGKNNNGFNGTYNSRADLFYTSFGINF